MKNQIRPSVGYNFIPAEKPSKPAETNPQGEKKIVLKVTDDLINDEPTAKVLADLQDFARVLTKAEQHQVRWYLYVDF